MLVYRVESFRGKGAYSLPVRGRSQTYSQHPCPDEDRLLRDWWLNNRTAEYYFGFGSLLQLSNWFTVDWWHEHVVYNKREMPEENKSGVSVYDCPDDLVKVGDKQAVFVKDKSERVRIIDFCQLVEGYWEGDGVSPAIQNKYVIPA